MLAAENGQTEKKLLELNEKEPAEIIRAYVDVYGKTKQYMPSKLSKKVNNYWK